ncbi:MAG: FAD-dependent oxidoreductase [Dehalococcoidia bacterium]|nr:FAD-dependent oxidoreductase [Dehalococcoidia bacterium]
MPDTPDVVIVGGGVVGCATAYFLARDGYSVTLIERDSVGSHASGFAYGGLSPIMGIIEDDPVLPLSEAAEAIHIELAERLPAESGVEYEYRRKTSLTLATNPAEVDALKEAHDWLKAHYAGEVAWHDEASARVLEPRVGPAVVAGLMAERSGEVEPYKFTLALWQAAERAGAVMRNASVAGVSRKAGDVSALRLESGEEIEAGAFVLAAGPWMGKATEWLGIDMPISPLKGQILRLQAPGDPLAVSLSWGHNYATTKPDGLLWCGTTEEHVGFDETPSACGRDTIMSSVIEVLPYLADAELVHHTACLRPVAPDGLPVVGPAPGNAGVFIASGTGRKGIFLGPAMARVVADMVIGKTLGVDVSGLSPARFSGAR